MQISGIVLPLLVATCPNLTSISLTQLPPRRVYEDATVEALAFAFLARIPRLVDVELPHMIFFLGYGPHFFSYHFLLLVGLVRYLEIESSLMEG